VFVSGACTRKKTCGGAVGELWLWSWMKAAATLATISKRRSKLQSLMMSMHDLNAGNPRRIKSVIPAGDGKTRFVFAFLYQGTTLVLPKLLQIDPGFRPC